MDNKEKKGKQDRERINVNEEYELRDWSEKFGISKEELQKIVEEVGPLARDVEKRVNVNVPKKGR